MADVRYVKYHLPILMNARDYLAKTRSLEVLTYHHDHYSTRVRVTGSERAQALAPTAGVL